MELLGCRLRRFGGALAKKGDCRLKPRDPQFEFCRGECRGKLERAGWMSTVSRMVEELCS